VAIFQEVCETARVMLGDLPGRVWADDVLRPLINFAYRDMQQKMSANGISVFRGYAQVNLSAADTDLTGVGSFGPTSQILADRHKYNQVAGGTKGTSNLTFTTPSSAAYLGGTLIVMYNGQVIPASYFTENAGAGSFTFSATFRTNFLAGGNIQSDDDIDLHYEPATQVTATTDLPTDLIVPLRLWEKKQGSTNKFVAMRKKVNGLPDVDQGERLGWWEWIDNKLEFIGSTEAKTLKIQYEKRLPDLGYRSPDNNVMIRGGENALAAGGAMLAPGKMKEFSTLYINQLNMLIQINVKPEQRAKRRRRPYGLRSHLGNRNIGRY